MKHLFLTLILCISTLSWAQQTNTLNRTVTAYGTANTDSESNLYKTDVTLSMDNYYENNPCKTLDELKEKYIEALKKLNVDTSKLTDEPLAFASLGYKTDGTILRFITDSKEEITQLVSLKMPQVKTSYIQMKTNISEKDIEKLLVSAINNANNNATALAKAAKAKIGKVVSISSYNYNKDSYWKSLNNTSEVVRVTVVYQLID